MRFRVPSEIIVPLSDWERQLFAKLVPEDHFLRQLEPLIDFELMRHTQLNMAVRLFVNLGSDRKLPHHTSMTYFRERVGAEAIQKIFDEVVAQASRLGLVRDRLRLKDATHDTVRPRASGLRLGSGGGDQCRGLRGSARRRTVAATRRALVRNE